jgi:MFS family permease
LLQEGVVLSAFTRVLVLLVAIIGFLFDTYELLMLPVIGTSALAELLKTTSDNADVRWWTGTILWIAALCGGVFGLLGGWMIDRFGRKTVMVGSILLYSLSPLAAAFSTELWQFVTFRCTTFIGVCVEMVAAVTWMAELFSDKRQRERAIAWSLAAASLGGLLVTVVDQWIVAQAPTFPALKTFNGEMSQSPWRYTLISGLVPGLAILLLMPFVPESRVWADKKKAGTLKRPSFAELFSPALRRTTIVTTILSACGYAAAFGCLQLTPTQVIQVRDEIAVPRGEGAPLMKQADELKKQADATTDEALKKELTAKQIPLRKEAGPKLKEARETQEARKSTIQLWQEVGGLVGRILLAVLVSLLPAKTLFRIFVIPGIVLFPLVYILLPKGDFLVFSIAIFFCGLLTVAQFSYLSEFLPKVFPMHLRGTGGSFATNVGGRMIGTMAATFNTVLLSNWMGGGPQGVAYGAAIIGGAVYLIGFVTSFFLPQPQVEAE